MAIQRSVISAQPRKHCTWQGKAAARVHLWGICVPLSDTCSSWSDMHLWEIWSTNSSIQMCIPETTSRFLLHFGASSKPSNNFFVATLMYVSRGRLGYCLLLRSVLIYFRCALSKTWMVWLWLERCCALQCFNDMQLVFVVAYAWWQFMTNGFQLQHTQI